MPDEEQYVNQKRPRKGLPSMFDVDQRSGFERESVIPKATETKTE